MEDMHIHLKDGVRNIDIMRKYIEECRNKKIKKVLFLDHGNRISEKHIPVLNDDETIKKFIYNIKKIREENNDMQIYMGIECDFSYDKDFQRREIEIMKKYEFDYVMGSVHGMNKEPYEKYLQANIDMVNKYPINIIGHIKLNDEFEKYANLIEKLFFEVKKKKIIVEINTSDRTVWNIRQLMYMLDLIKKYNIEYTIGSDAHKIEEIGYRIKEMYNKIRKIKGNEKREIEYTIVSRGTEKNGSKGYMGVTKENNTGRSLVLSNHGDKYVNTYKDAIHIKKNTSIESITLSRFELIIDLALKNNIKIIKEEILITGFGSLGFACLMYLLKKEYKNINIYVKDIKKFQERGIKELNLQYNANIKFVKEFSGYQTYFECTGASEIIEKIIKSTLSNEAIFLIGTPRENKYLINPLDIHRKNLIIIGGHELTGHNQKERNRRFKIIVKENNKINFLYKFVNVYSFSKNKVKDILNEKNNFMEVMKYDL